MLTLLASSVLPLLFSVEQAVFLDECVWGYHDLPRQYGCALVGQRAVQHGNLLSGTHWHILLALSR